MIFREYWSSRWKLIERNVDYHYYYYLTRRLWSDEFRDLTEKQFSSSALSTFPRVRFRYSIMKRPAAYTADAFVFVPPSFHKSHLVGRGIVYQKIIAKVSVSISRRHTIPLSELLLRTNDTSLSGRSIIPAINSGSGLYLR